MTNTELLGSAPASLLTSIERQRRFLARIGVQQKPCPHCSHPNNLPEAFGVSINEFDFGFGPKDDEYRCCRCNLPITYILPWPVGDWHWQIS